MNLDLVDKIAKAVLYEGYMLYPYRPSSVKNRQRWNFGVLYPPAYSSRQVGSDTSKISSECLVESAEHPEIEVHVRFLQLVQRNIGVLKRPVRDLAPGVVEELTLVDSVEIGGKQYQAWQEAVEREFTIPLQDLEVLRSYDFHFAVQTSSEPVRDATGEIAAVIVRDGECVTGRVSVSAERVGHALKLHMVVENTTSFTGSAREEALLFSMASAHVVLGVRNGGFVSLLETPEGFHDAADSCHNTGVWPVLVGAPGVRDTLLISPIILYDYPQIAPESAGDLFDGTEIDEILSLRIMTLTDDEKREMRQSDDRARQILDRTETLPEEQFMKLHGVLRGLRPVKEERA